ncbi:hypothetical protein N7462_000182 [Penicillium macrosclerotiorum]|uniref:uncharacterized protein n=1 Tax=Penicillium macrosclerotiorum TaxID=303699 RepID=UPI002548569D|nr:uncharacterized protein N7462_000182 [Penicillium macrosclerotiorum]KAJ5698177.1 hypothetical protein N7462_000182 [Penicillium macrosclerotiorum]
MRAAVCREAKQPVMIEEVAMPTVGPRQLLVKVLAASLCDTDIGVLNGDYGREQFPLIIGHEAVGIVQELGLEADAFGFKVGHLVGTAPYHQMCLECYECRWIGPEFCSRMKIQGIFSPGFFAEYCTMDAASAVVVPDDDLYKDNEKVGDKIARLSPIFCAGITVWDAIERAKLAPGESLAVIGAGGLGQLAVQYASALGAKVIALDLHDEQLRAVEGPNAVDKTLNIKDLGFKETQVQFKKLNGGHGADVILVTTGAAIAYQTAFYCIAPLGRIIAVGLPKDPIPIPAMQITARCNR